MKTYIPELSEVRMINRAPARAVNFGADKGYIFSCFKNVEQNFGIVGFPGRSLEQMPARTLIKQLIVWWHTLEPVNESQQMAYARIPGTIRLIDTYSSWLAERAGHNTRE